MIWDYDVKFTGTEFNIYFGINRLSSLGGYNEQY